MKKCFFHFILLSVSFLSLVLFLAPVDPDQPMSNWKYGTYKMKSAMNRSLSAVTGDRSQSDILHIEIKKYSKGRSIASMGPPVVDKAGGEKSEQQETQTSE